MMTGTIELNVQARKHVGIEVMGAPNMERFRKHGEPRFDLSAAKGT